MLVLARLVPGESAMVEQVVAAVEVGMALVVAEFVAAGVRAYRG